MKVHMMPQTSPDWWEIRRGKVTASDMDKIITPAKGQPSASQDKYIAWLLACVREPASMAPYFGNGVHRPTAAMETGSEREAAALRWYECEKNVSTQLVGFCESDCGRYGASPDAVVGLQRHELGDTIEGGVEIKCPEHHRHIEYLLSGEMPIDYRCQVHGQLVVMGAKWVDFMSYYPGEEPLIVRITPDAFTEKLKAELERFLEKYLAAAKKFGIMLGQMVTPDGEVIEATF